MSKEKKMTKEEFKITIDKKITYIEKLPSYKATIQIGQFKEDFYCNSSYWKREDYLNQWDDALKKVSLEKKDALLVSNMYDPKSGNFLFYWVLYVEDKKVYIQEQILFLDELKECFDELNLYKYIKARETIGENKEKISQWETTIEKIKLFREENYEASK